MPAADYEAAKRIAAAGAPKDRRQLAARTDIRPEILYYLAEDLDADVRRAVAGNPMAPIQAGPLLAGDRDEAVRCALAERFARLLPRLGGDDRGRAARTAAEVVERLARDQLPRVRRVLAEALKHAAGVPPHIVRMLANDSDSAVACPILEFSPLLDDATLIEIVAGGPDPLALAAIARRRDLAPPVGDALVDAGDESAIAALLANPSAQIREETLDRLVERAAAVPRWHAPLVRRPHLSPRAVRGLARIVAATLLNELASRADLDGETAATVAAAVRARLDRDLPDLGAGEAQDAPGAPAEARARRLYDAGTLDEAALLDALDRGDRAFAAAALALMAGTGEGPVHKAVSLKNAKAIVALAWKAGLAMRTAVQLQLRLGRGPPPAVVNARGGTDNPLDEDEMRWQLDLVGA
jgi:uncharacterized protein (DUF2336 family)